MSFSSSSLRSVVVGLEEGAEFALGGVPPGELFEVQAQHRFELGLVFTFLAGAAAVGVQVAQALTAGLQLAIVAFSRARLASQRAR